MHLRHWHGDHAGRWKRMAGLERYRCSSFDCPMHQERSLPSFASRTFAEGLRMRTRSNQLLDQLAFASANTRVVLARTRQDRQVNIVRTYCTQELRYIVYNNPQSTLKACRKR